MAEGKIVAKLNGIRASLPIALILLMGLDLYYNFRVEFQLGPKIFIFLEAVLQNTAEARRGLQSKTFYKAIPIKCFVSHRPPLERLGRSLG